MANGIDVSNNNGPIAWDRVAADGIEFAIVKATEGMTFYDSFFSRNWAGMKAAGLARGAYHFARPDRNSAADEAAWFLAHVRSFLEPGDVVALDIERGAGDLSAWALTWLRTVETALGFKPLLYTSPDFIAEHNLNVPGLGLYGLWLASWGTTAPAAPSPWPFWAIWQKSATATVAGVEGDVDMDEFAGGVDQFRAYGLPQPPPTPAKLPLNDAERLQLVHYVSGGSGVADLTAWLAAHEDVSI